MRFSVVIPTYNRKDILRRVLAALAAQDYADYEVIVADGGSRDGTPEMVAAEFPRVRCLSEPKSGPSAARNTGIRAARGEIIAFTDDDCLPPPDWLSRLADGYRRHPTVNGVAGRCEPPEEVWRANVLARQELWATWYAYGLTPDRPEYIAAGLDVPGATNNVSYRRSALLAVGGFSENFARHIAGEERELRERLCARGYDGYLYVPVKVLHLRSYRWKDFFTQALETSLGSKHYHRRRARAEPTLPETARLKRGRLPGWREAAMTGDGQLVSVLVAERVVYLVGRLLAEKLVLRLIALFSRL